MVLSNIFDPMTMGCILYVVICFSDQDVAGGVAFLECSRTDMTVATAEERSPRFAGMIMVLFVLAS